MVGLALLNFLVGRGQSASTARPHPSHGTPPWAHTSRMRFFCGSFTLPARQQCDRALWMMNLLDLALGSLYSRGPGGQGSQQGWPGKGRAQHWPPGVPLTCVLRH